MLIRIRKLQLLSGVCLFMQIFFARWIIPFHLAAMLLSVVIIYWQRTFRGINIQYNYYLVGLYLFRIWIFTVRGFYFFDILYMIGCLYVSIFIILSSFRAVL